MTTRICVICGKEFVPHNNMQKTCSPQCSKENKNRVRRARYYTAPKRYCLKRDVHVVRDDIAARRLNGESLCMWCGNEFATKNPLEKFCSDEHGQLFYNQLFNR